MNAIILAATVTFAGIVMHYDVQPSPREKRAVIVYMKDLKHDPVLKVSSSVAKYYKGNGPAWKVKTDSTGNYVFDLTGERLKIVGARDGVALSGDYNKRVMKIKEIVDGTAADEEVYEEIKNGNAHVKDKTTAFIDYAGGTLSAPDCFLHPIEFIPKTSDDPRCLARRVVLKFTPKDSGGTAMNTWEIQDVDDSTRTIIITDKNAQVDVENAARQSGFHYLHYDRVLKKGTPLRNMTYFNGRCSNTCEVVPTPFGVKAVKRPKYPKKPKGPTVECSNSNYP